MFRLRLRLSSAGLNASFVDWQHLCNLFPRRALLLLEAMFVGARRSNSDQENAPPGRGAKLEDYDLKALLEAAMAEPEFTWLTLVDHVVLGTTDIVDIEDLRLKLLRRLIDHEWIVSILASLSFAPRVRYFTWESYDIP